jgi:hypothetical protein
MSKDILRSTAIHWVRLSNGLPFSCKPAAEPAPRFYTMSLRRDCQLQRLVRQRIKQEVER